MHERYEDTDMTEAQAWSYSKKPFKTTFLYIRLPGFISHCHICPTLTDLDESKMHVRFEEADKSRKWRLMKSLESQAGA